MDTVESTGKPLKDQLCRVFMFQTASGVTKYLSRRISYDKHVLRDVYLSVYLTLHGFIVSVLADNVVIA